METGADGVRCGSCGVVAPATARFCPACGSGLASWSDSPTRTALAATESSEAVTTPRATTEVGGGPAETSAGAFAPGKVLAQRYRIVALLGRGGMGVVYRADDLKLGQPVALKFLPPSLAADPDRLQALYAETRHARQVSHPNVCRVYDVGEHEGRAFMSMEYVDGEDLASLLRRIGRVPAAKALAIAHELCAGLAAAHALGVIHRDLKPANVMLDGHGRARITDFGLAAPVEDERAGAAGTPLYMAPEQLAGGRASVRSDVYALGLILYELYTGRRAHAATTLAELRASHAAPPPRPSRFVPDIETAVERAIVSCLDPDPSGRPASARQLAATLPGGDPLAAALALGQTPSPEIVAAAGLEGGLRPAVAWPLLGAFLGLLAGVAALAPRVTLVGVAHPAKGPEALAERARQIVSDAGYGEEPADVAYWFEPAVEALRVRASQAGDDAESGAATPGSLIRFVYRQSPRALVSANPLRNLAANNPPLDLPGMVNVEMEDSGRLVRLQTVPGLSDPGTAPVAERDWSPLLEAAGLGRSRLVEAASDWLPPVPFDLRQTWQAEVEPATPIRVRAAALRGRPVLFSVEPVRLDAGQGEAIGRGHALAASLWVLTYLVTIGAAAYFARRNVRLGRGDAQGAFRVAALIVLTWFPARALDAHHAYGSSGDLFVWLRTNLASSAWSGLFGWLVYMALEPYARRHWPHLLISWSRLLRGRWHDPRVGRDLLIGLVGGTGAVVVAMAIVLGASGTTAGQVAPLGTDLGALLGPRHYLASLLYLVGAALVSAFIVVFFLAIGVAVLRHRGAAVLPAAALVLVAFLPTMDAWMPLRTGLLVGAWGAACLLGVTIAWGLVAGMATAFAANFLMVMPVVLDTSAWYGGASWFGILLLAALGSFGFSRSLGGRPLLAEDD